MQQVGQLAGVQQVGPQEQLSEPQLLEQLCGPQLLEQFSVPQASGHSLNLDMTSEGPGAVVHSQAQALIAALRAEYSRLGRLPRCLLCMS